MLPCSRQTSIRHSPSGSRLSSQQAQSVHKVLQKKGSFVSNQRKLAPTYRIVLYFGHRESLDRELAGARPGSTQKVTNGGCTLGRVVVHAW